MSETVNILDITKNNTYNLDDTSEIKKSVENESECYLMLGEKIVSKFDDLQSQSLAVSFALDRNYIGLMTILKKFDQISEGFDYQNFLDFCEYEFDDWAFVPSSNDVYEYILENENDDLYDRLQTLKNFISDNSYISEIVGLDKISMPNIYEKIVVGDLKYRILHVDNDVTIYKKEV